MMKLLAIDMDGTLLDDKKEISPRNQQALRQVAEAGIMVVLCTGRPLSGIQPYFDQLQLPHSPYAIGNNGCLILSTDDWSILSYQSTPLAHVERLAKFLEEFPSLNLVLFTPHANYALGQELNEATKNDAIIESSILYHTDLENFRSLNIPVLVPIFMGEAEELDQLQLAYGNQLAENFQPVRSLDYAFEALPKGVNKASALARLTEKLGITPEEVMAVGDGNNDIEMLQWAGLGIAMKNSSPSLLKFADDITDSHNESGLAKAIEKHLLNVK
ncbi:TPA: HAD family phosphatase [Streptococcus suis]|nr:HAD family phosphatase [Streptococcus suis]